MNEYNFQPRFSSANNETPEYSQDIWEPGKREQYKSYRKPASPGVVVEAHQRFRDDVEKFWNQKLFNKGEGRAIVGADLGKSFIRYCQVAGLEGGGNIQPKFEEISKDLGPKKGQEIRQRLSGFIAEYSVAQEFTSKNIYDVYLPNDSFEGIYEEGNGIDLWIDLINGLDDNEPEEGNIALAAQIKCFSFINPPKNHCFVLRDSEDVDKVMTKIINPKNIHGGVVKVDKIGKDLNRLVEYAGWYENAIASLMVFDTPGSDTDRTNPTIDIKTGRMNTDVSTRLMDDVAAIKELYLKKYTKRAA